MAEETIDEINVKKEGNMNSALIIPGVDVQRGIAMTGGTEAAYLKVLSMFYKDIKVRLQLLRFILFEGSMDGNKFPEKHLASFITQVHAMKSASATIGAGELSTEAAMLEDAGNTGNLTLIMENLNGFIAHLTELAENIRTVPGLLPEGLKAGEPKPEKPDLSMYRSLFDELIKALKLKNIPDIDRIMDELNKNRPNEEIKEFLDQISDQVLMAEFEIAVKTIDEFINL